MVTEWLDANWKWLFAVINVLFFAACWVLSRQFATKEEHGALAIHVGELSQKIESMPDVERLHSLELQIEKLSGELGGLMPLLKRIEHQSNLLLENELNNGKS